MTDKREQLNNALNNIAKQCTSSTNSPTHTTPTSAKSPTPVPLTKTDHVPLTTLQQVEMDFYLNRLEHLSEEVHGERPRWFWPKQIADHCNCLPPMEGLDPLKWLNVSDYIKAMSFIHKNTADLALIKIELLETQVQQEAASYARYESIRPPKSLQPMPSKRGALSKTELENWAVEANRAQMHLNA